MSKYLIQKGTGVTIRRVSSRPDAWQMHDTRRDLELTKPVKSDSVGLTFQYEGWLLYVAHNRVKKTR